MPSVVLAIIGFGKNATQCIIIESSIAVAIDGDVWVGCMLAMCGLLATWYGIFGFVARLLTFLVLGLVFGLVVNVPTMLLVSMFVKLLVGLPVNLVVRSVIDLLTVLLIIFLIDHVARLLVQLLPI